MNSQTKNIPVGNIPLTKLIILELFNFFPAVNYNILHLTLTTEKSGNWMFHKLFIFNAIVSRELNQKNILKACVRYFLSNFDFFTKWYSLKTEKCFLFHLKSSFHSQDSNFCNFPSSFPHPRFLHQMEQMELE